MVKLITSVSKEKQVLTKINLYLIGMMGAGKTTVGQILAEKLNYRFFDTDTLIEQVAGKTINEIFTNDGESTFREIETKVLSELSAYTNLAIATGGGIILKRENWSYLHHGLIVWLDAPAELLMSRLANDNTRPLLKDPNPLEKLQKLLEERQALYSQADLHISISTEDTPADIAAKVMTAIPQVLKPQINNQ